MTIKLNDEQRKALKTRLVDVLMSPPWTITDFGKQPHDSMKRYLVSPRLRSRPVGPAEVPPDMGEQFVFSQGDASLAKFTYSSKITEALIAAIEAT